MGVNGGVYWHLDKYFMPWRDTINDDILPQHPSCIFQFAHGIKLPHLDNNSFYNDPTLTTYDYVITFDAPPDVIERARNSANTESLMMTEKWALFRVVK
jgi:hypothetical protein